MNLKILSFELVELGNPRMHPVGVWPSRLCAQLQFGRRMLSQKRTVVFIYFLVLDIEIRPPKSVLGTSSNSGWWHLTGDILLLPESIS